MRKEIIIPLVFWFIFAASLGYLSGRIFSYLHPMRSIEGYWEMNSHLDNMEGGYHVNSRISIMNREVNSSVEVYDKNHYVKARRNIVFDVMDIDNNVLAGRILSVSMVDDNDHGLSDFLNTPFTISHPTIYRLNKDTIFIEQSQGHPVNSLRLLTRVET
ncbi:Uncharacterised protein [Yersinia massiliensis]|uniref:hypothetical protein n=1 Tax=Yersinia massiliensis TaxID=419257 RepID=UPI0005DF44FD|nr:hypothetical protein [Yersinia massiliensis]CNH74347.1 Uncharacterised protein [Yersinia massiliensis]